MAHTKRPWVTHFNQAKGVWEVWPVSMGTGRICTVMNRDPDDEESNAHLIAAAPDLLEACKQACVAYDYIICSTPTGDERNKLTEQNILRMAAIAKATA